MATRLGIDVGGTFTDLVFYDHDTGEFWADKRPTTPGEIWKGIRDVIDASVPAERFAATDYFLHGTTVGINAVLERRGARVGLLTTEHFRDVLEMRRGEREHMLDLQAKIPPPIVPRRLRRGIRERVLVDGTVLTELEPQDVLDALEVFQAEDVASIAIAFLHAYANPAHELEAARLLREAGFEGAISLSHQVSGEYREYERTTTTVVDAYVRPSFSTYLDDLDRTLGERGFHGERLVTRSGGGAMTFREAQERPFETIMSGPVAGAVGAAELCRMLGLPSGITADVGGTSTDCTLIIDGEAAFTFQGEVDGLPLQAPWVDVRSIGAGGGSIAHLDPGGLLRVGPRSAGAVPGPVSYGRGGTEPTVTDAAAVLGMLGAGKLAGGVTIDLEAAREAFAALQEPLELDTDHIAQGVMRIAAAAMAEAIRSITVERGHDPRGSALIMFGGAGGMFGTLLAEELENDTVIIPPFAGNFSAWGLLGQDVVRSTAVTSINRLTPEGLASANAALAGLFARLEGREGVSSHGAVREVHADLRYANQEHTLTVKVPCDADGAIALEADQLAELFTDAHQTAFGHVADAAAELVSVRATLRTALPRKGAVAAETGHGGPVTVDEVIEAYSFAAGERVEFSIVDRAQLSAGATLAGPAIVVEGTATTYVDAGFHLEVHELGALLIRRSS
jgi:N-methylhydantoinase A